MCLTAKVNGCRPGVVSHKGSFVARAVIALRGVSCS